MKYKSVTGTRDILPDEEKYWRFIEDKIFKITTQYGYRRVEPPIFEETPLYIRGVGEGTDIIEKEMYSFKDKSDNSLTLRPEYTAGVIRLYLENGLHVLPKPVKLFSMGPIFRYERPQAGRFRQHTQLNIEALGEQDPAIDLEVMSIAWQLYSELGFKDISFQLNSTGCPKCRPGYIESLKTWYQTHVDEICNDCKRRLERNPLRVLDCKVETCQPVIQGAPIIRDHLCKECRDHFTTLLKYLDMLGRSYKINHKLVRGLDYYTKTVFEVWAEGIGSQSAMCGGGRYDGLIEQLGGPPTPGIGFGSGIERIILSMKNLGLEPPTLPEIFVFLVHAGDKAKAKAIELTFLLRQHNFNTRMAFGYRSFKSQFREANRSGAKYAFLVGEDELKTNTVSVKNLETGDQTGVPISQLVEFLENAKP